MPNTLLTPTAVTRRALKILHQKLNFVGNINRQYDSSFAQSGAKIGDSLKIRTPNQFTTRTGATHSAQAISETSETLQVSSQIGVDWEYTSADWTLSIDDYSSRILDPAMAVLAAAIESTVLASAINSVYPTLDNSGSAFTMADALDSRKKLVDYLAPSNDRTLILDTQSSVDFVTDTKSLFQDAASISKQYKEGMMSRAAGFDIYENTLLSSFTSGSTTTLTTHATANTTNGSKTLTVTGTPNLKAGDVFTVAGCYAAHPETKADTGRLMQFVADTTVTSGTTVTFSPAIYVSGAQQNIITSIPASVTVTKVGSASEVFKPSLAFQKDFAVFATADLVLPRNVNQAARHEIDGISMRYVDNYDVVNDKFPCRFDVLYGFKVVRPQLACKIYSN